MSLRRPNYWNLLTNDEQEVYTTMQQFTSRMALSKQYTKVEVFKDVLQSILTFQNKDEKDKWRRSIACGIFFFEGGVAVNTSQLKILINRCRSSINSSLNEIGYSNIPKKNDGLVKLEKLTPFFFENPNEARKWTIRYFSDNSNQFEPKEIENINKEKTELSENFNDNEDEISIFFDSEIF